MFLCVLRILNSNTDLFLIVSIQEHDYVSVKIEDTPSQIWFIAHLTGTTFYVRNIQVLALKKKRM